MTTKPSTSQPLTLSIERMSYGPDAIAHTLEGKTVFVKSAVPGDLAVVVLTHEEKRFAHAEVVEVLRPSPSRVQSLCPYAGVCGGCPWAEIAYETQAGLKRQSVVDALVRIGKFDALRAEALVGPCESPSEPWGYRNKIELASHTNKQGKMSLGMHRSDGEGVLKVDQCLLLDKKFRRLPHSVAGAVGYMSGSHGLKIDRVGIRASSRTGSTEIALWTAPSAFPRAQMAKVLTDAAKPGSVVRVLSKGPLKARRVSSVECLSGKGFWKERIAGSTMRLSAPSFFQVNTAGAEKLVELVMAGLSPQEDDVAMDLYSGAGTFTLPLAKQCSYVSAVEAYGPAVRDLRRNLEQAQLDNVGAIGGDADREFPDIDADIVVVDPPRAGLDAHVVKQLSAQRARAIAYVSCDPATLARDLARFEEQGSYRVASIVPVDLFPQTFHIENVTILERVGK